MPLTQQSHIRYTLFYTLIKNLPMTYTWTHHLSQRTSSYPQELTLTQGSTIVDFLWSWGFFLFCFVLESFVLAMFWFCGVRVVLFSCWGGICFWLFAECGEYHSICMKQKVCMLVTQSCLTLSDPMDCRAPLSLGFSRQEYWRRLPFPSPGIFPGI